MSNCKYSIDLGEGNIFEFPSILLSENEGNTQDFKTSLKKWLIDPENDIQLKDLLNKYKPELIIPSDIENTIIAQHSTNSAKFFIDWKLRKQWNYFTNTVLNSKDYDFNRQNILFVNMPEDIIYEYLPKQDIILLNRFNLDNSENLFKSLIEMSVSKYLNIDNPKEAILKEDPEVINFLIKDNQSIFTLSNLQYLFAGDTTLKGTNVLEELSKSPELWKDKQENLAKLHNNNTLDSYYSPETLIPITELKTGDIIIKYNKTIPYQEMFIDYSINANGEYSINYVGENSEWSAHFNTKFPSIKARKFVENKPKFSEYDISEKGKEFTLNVSNIDSFDFVYNNIKRGDKIITEDNKTLLVQNIIGSNFILGKNKIKKFPENQTSTTKANKISKIILDLKYHPELNEKINLDDYYVWNKNIQNFAIQKEDLVEYIISGESFIGKVLDTTQNELIIGDVIGDTIRGISIIDRGKVNTIKTKSKNFEPLVIKLLEEDHSRLKEVAAIALNLENKEFINTEYNVIEAYKSFPYKKGDYIIKNNEVFVITNIFNQYVQITNGQKTPEGNYILDIVMANNLIGSIILNTRPQDPKFEYNSLQRNSFLIDNVIKPGLQSIESRIYKEKIGGRIFIADNSKWSEYDEKVKSGDWIDITNNYPGITKYSYRYKKGDNESGTYVRNINKNLTEIKDAKDNFPLIFKNLIVGSFVREEKGFNFWQVEKIIEDKALISFSYYKGNKVNTIKKLINANTSIQRVLIPFKSTATIKKINDSINNNIKSKTLSDNDSIEILVNMTSILQDKYGININFINDEDMLKLSGIPNTRAIIYEGQYYINSDRASISDPLHEFVHIILGSMKVSNYDKYVELVNTVKKHELFITVSQEYNETQLDRLEETFIRLFTDTVRSKILVDPIFNEDSFTNAIKDSVKVMFNLDSNLEDKSTYELLDQNIKDILIEFNSSLIENTESFYNKNDAITMIEISSTLRNLLNNGQLIEICNG